MESAVTRSVNFKHSLAQAFTQHIENIVYLFMFSLLAKTQPHHVVFIFYTCQNQQRAVMEVSRLCHITVDIFHVITSKTCQLSFCTRAGVCTTVLFFWVREYQLLIFISRKRPSVLASVDFDKCYCYKGAIEIVLNFGQPLRNSLITERKDA